MKSPTKISVLMAVYNTEFAYIKRAIDAVLNQDFQDFELIIIDDGSKENNRELLLACVEENEDKLIYIRHSNRGQSESINRGVLNCVGEYITILDSDDEYKPNHLSACLSAIDNYDLICSTSATVVDDINDFYVPDKNDLTKLIHLDNSVLFGTLFGRKEVFSSVNFRSGFAADADFFEKAKLNFRVKKADLRTYIYYRNIPTSICTSMKNKHLSTN